MHAVPLRAAVILLFPAVAEVKFQVAVHIPFGTAPQDASPLEIPPRVELNTGVRVPEKLE